MKKKFINGLLLLAVASFSCSTFTSCKDTDDDLRAEWSQSDQKLQKLYDDLKEAQEKCCNDIKGFLAPYLKDDNTLQKVLDGYATDDDIKDMVTTDMLGAKTPEEFQEWVESVAEALTSINNYQNIGAHLTTLMTEYEANQKAGITNSDLDKRIADLEKEFHITEKQWTDAQATLKIVEDNKDGIVWVHNNLAYLQTLQTLIGNWGEGVEGTASIAEKIRGLIADCQQLNTRLETAEGDIKTLKADLLKLQNQVATLQNRLDLLVTSLLVQGTFNPLFGNFSLPIGIQSNMVVNYYGQSLKDDYSFPNAPEAATVDTKDVLTADELAVLQASGLTAYSVKNGDFLMNPTLGKLYFTVNPNNVDYKNVEFSLVNSQDVESPVKLDKESIKPSDAVLTFGYSRAANNGFFEADAVVDETNVEEAALHIDQSLKTSIKNILKDGRNNLRSNVVALMKAVYDQFNGFLPAYGLKAAWTVEEKVLDENGNDTGETITKDYATYSNYNIAATTFKPLSFGFLYGESFNHKLPTIDPISQSIINIDEIKEKVNFKFDFDFDLSGTPDFSVDFGDFDLTYAGDDIMLDLSNIKVVVGDQEGYLEGEIALTSKDLQPLFDELNKQLKSKFTGISAEIEQNFKDAIQSVYDNVNSEVNRMLAQMEGEINEQVKDMIDDILGDAMGKLDNYIGKFNSFINRYNSLADRLNAYLENPNHFLQPTMFYNAVNGGDYFLSNNPAQPTVFKNNGGSGITVYATTYTAEVLAPAFKKVVAVANVLGADGKPVADAVAQASAINKKAAGVLATVVDGQRKRFAIPTADMKKGLTYEILYTALDYHGVTATQRFYIAVE